jgi:hypothetical protein
MTILKKLSIAAVLALGLQFSAGAFTTETDENRNSIILVYAQDLHNQNNKQAQTVATWLNTQVINYGCFRREIVEIITNNNLTEQSKLTLFTAMMKKQESDHKREVITGICGTILLTGVFGTLAYMIISQPHSVFCPGLGARQQVNIFS